MYLRWLNSIWVVLLARIVWKRIDILRFCRLYPFLDFFQCIQMLSIYNTCGNLHHVIFSDIPWIFCFCLFLTPQDGNILHKDNLTVKDISQHTFRTTLKDKKFASCWKERLTLNSCLQLVNTRLQERTIRSCLMVLNIKSIDQGEQQSKHKLPFKFSQKKRR